MTRIFAFAAGGAVLAVIINATSEPLIDVIVNLIILAGGIGILGAASRDQQRE